MNFNFFKRDIMINNHINLIVDIIKIMSLQFIINKLLGNLIIIYNL